MLKVRYRRWCAIFGDRVLGRPLGWEADAIIEKLASGDRSRQVGGENG
jgi:hypothetical protein